MSGLEVGQELPAVTATATLSSSVRYAGASGDLNPLHFDPAFAADVSPTGGVIAHGMYAMGLASRLVAGAAGGPEHVAELQVRFTRPWPLGATATFTGKVTAHGEDGIKVALAAMLEDGTRILRGTALLRPGPAA